MLGSPLSLSERPYRGRDIGRADGRGGGVSKVSTLRALFFRCAKCAIAPPRAPFFRVSVLSFFSGRLGVLCPVWCPVCGRFCSGVGRLMWSVIVGYRG